MKAMIALVSVWAGPVLAQKEHGFDNHKASGQAYLSPQETVKRMTVPPEFEVKLFAGEPMLANPIAFTIDEKGRVWAVECFEYPSRTPAGKMPRDRIVILEDTDGDGACDKRTVFAEGKDFPERFDMASGIEVGYGGVFVGAAPNLWFIENKNDKPGKFEKLLTGFGSQDTHEILNTFQWGPDGWLYGLHGIFTNSTVKSLDGPETRMNAAVWRYHPVTKKFEIFAEGTSNPWGMDWRNTDGQFILACCVIPHLYHIVPGGIYQRQAGASFNPYSYGYIKEISDHTFHKESGWAHAGLISLDVPHMPERFRNSVIFGSIHGCSLKQNILMPNGSSYIASRGDDFLVSNDKNVRPINLRWGPNGDIYMIDWHDQNPCHQAKADSWDYERGRVYRIQLKNKKSGKPLDLSNATAAELANFALNGATPWHRRTALRLLQQAERNLTAEVLSGLVAEHLADPSPERALRAVFLLLANGRSPLLHVSKMDSIPPDIQVWNIRRYANLTPVATGKNANFTAYAEMARTTTSPLIRRELASMAIRRSDDPNIQVVTKALMIRTEDENDPLIPHLLWTSYEQQLMRSDAATQKEMQWLHQYASGSLVVRDYIVPRVMRRLIATGKPLHRALALNFLRVVSDSFTRTSALNGLVLACKDQTMDAPPEWKPLRDELLATKDDKITAMVNMLSVSFRDPEAIGKAVTTMLDVQQPLEARVVAIRQLGLLKDKETLAPILTVALNDPQSALRVEAIRALSAFNDPSVPKQLLAKWSTQPPEARTEIVALLSTRAAWARELLLALKAGTIERQLVTDNTILRIQAFKDAELNKLIETAWGRTRATPADLVAQIDAMRKELDSGPGSFLKGKAMFEAHCAKCHKFDGKGADVGPALDGAARDIEYLLANVLDPNRVIGSPYFVRQATTADGQVIQGVLAEEDERSITLKVENSVLKKFAKADLDGPVKVLERSIMPEGLTAGMKPQDFRDLVRYAMAHPFPASAVVNGVKTAVPVTGRIAMPENKPVIIEIAFTANEATTTKLLVGSANAFEVFLDDKPLGKGVGTERTLSPDGEPFAVTLAKGDHNVKLVVQSKMATKGVSLRFLDPDRRISYQD